MSSPFHAAARLAILSAILPDLLFAPALAQSPTSTHPAAAENAAMETQWRVSASPGLDALLLIGAASGDVLQQHYYAEAIELVRGRMPAESVAALDRLDTAFRVDAGRLTGPTLAFIFSAGPMDSIDAVIASAREPDRHLRPALGSAPGWDAERYARIRALMPDVVLALEGLQAIGFEDYYAAQIRPLVEESVAGNLAAVSAHDIIPEQARLLGRPLEPEIEILVVRFAQPYGIRILGQRFVAYYGWDGATQLRIAAHEIFHPPFQLGDPDLLARLAPLEADPWIRNIVETHNPAFGYNTFEGYVNEDSTQALDQIVSERLGFARDPARRWSHADDGMHLLAAALYHAMKEDGFDQTGGVYADWLVSALDRGLLTPAEIRRRAEAVVGPAAAARWDPAPEPHGDAPPEIPN